MQWVGDGAACKLRYLVYIYVYIYIFMQWIGDGAVHDHI